MANTFINSTFIQSEYSDVANAKQGDNIRIYGMIQNVRVTKWGGFIIIRKPDGLLQTVIQNETSSIFDENGEKIGINDLSRETAIILEGQVNSANIKDKSVKYNTIEIAVTKINVISKPSTKIGCSALLM